jgi:hypothetical protein
MQLLVIDLLSLKRQSLFNGLVILNLIIGLVIVIELALNSVLSGEVLHPLGLLIEVDSANTK